MIELRPQLLKMALVTGALFAAQPANAMPVLAFEFTPSAVDFMAGGTIDFDGDSLFDDFTVNSPLVGLNGLMGEIGGAFSFTGLGDVTSTGGTFEIDDGGGSVLTGDLDFDNIAFTNTFPGPLQIVTLAGDLDFNMPYAGINSDLTALSNYTVPLGISVNFLFSGLDALMTVEDLFVSGSGAGTPFIDPGLGSVTALPEPGSLALLGLGVLSIGLYGRRRRPAQPRDPQSTSSGCRESYSS